MLHQKHESYKYVLPPKNWVEWITTRHEKHFTTSKMYILRSAGLSMNILHAGNKSLVQRCFFKNSTGNLLHALMEVTMHHMHSTYHQWYVEQQHILEIQKWLKTNKKHAAEIASLRKLKSTQQITPDTLC